MTKQAESATANQDRPALTIEVTAGSLDRAAVLVSSYDAENDHPLDVVRSILQASLGDRYLVRETGDY